MKKFYFLIVALIAINGAVAQGCLHEGITFSTQEQIDNFQTDYPGCTEIEGNVKILGNNISNLAGLNAVSRIGGNLVIGKYWEANPLLVNLEGLNGLTYVGGTLAIIGNDALVNLTGLENLDTIGLNLEFDSNDKLVNCIGLGNLSSLGGSLKVFNSSKFINLVGIGNITTIPGNFWIANSDLQNFNGLESLESIGGYFDVEASELQSFSALKQLSEIGQEFAVYKCDEITDFSGLENLTSIGGNFRVFWNQMLNDFSGLNNLALINGDIEINYNQFLTSLSGLESLEAESIDNIWLYKNWDLSACNVQSVCDYLVSPGGSVNIFDNAPGCNNVAEIANGCGIALTCLPYGNYYFNSQSDIDNFSSVFPGCYDLYGNVIIEGEDITNLSGLTEVTSIEKSLGFYRNDSLTNFSGLNSLSTIGENLIIGGYEGEGNLSLINLIGLEELESVGNMIHILYNESLQNISGLNSLTKVGRLYLHSNDALYSLEGINNLDSITDDLTIGSNKSLNNISDLHNLTFIGGNISISNNDYLKSLSGLDNVEAESIGYLDIVSNDSLSACAVKSLCDYLAAPDAWVNIKNNTPGCNSREEVEYACLVGIQNIIQENKLSIFPNPSSSSFTIQFSLEKEEQVTLLVLNNLGQVVATLANERLSEGLHEIYWNSEEMPAGVYFYNIRIGNQAGTGKMVLMK